jgi:hypothetical protein
MTYLDSSNMVRADFETVTCSLVSALLRLAVWDGVLPVADVAVGPNEGYESDDS